MPIEARRALWARLAIGPPPERPRRGRDRGRPSTRSSRRSTRSSRAPPAAGGWSGSSTERSPRRTVSRARPGAGPAPASAAPAPCRPGRASGATAASMPSRPPSTSRASSAICPELADLADRERPVADRPVAGHDRARSPARRAARRSPASRSGSASPKYGVASASSEVAGEQDVGVGHEHDDVVVGVAAAEVAQLDRSARPARSRPSPSPRTSGRAGRTRPRRARAARSGSAAIGHCRCRSPVASIIVTQRSWPQIVGRPERVVAEAVVAVAVGVDDDADGQRRSAPGGPPGSRRPGGG